MMDKEYFIIIKDIIDDENFQKLKYEKHHGISRYEHLIRVSKKTFLITKRKKLDYKKATRAALMHDFFYSSETKTTTLKGALKHPILAYEHASKLIELSPKEGNIIRSHMFPITKELPKSREAWIVVHVDKTVGFMEFIKYKFNPFHKKNNK